MATFTQVPEGQPILTVTLPGFTLAQTTGEFSVTSTAGLGAANVLALAVGLQTVTLPPLSILLTPVPSATVLDVTLAYLTNANCPTLVQYPLTGQRGYAAFTPLHS